MNISFIILSFKSNQFYFILCKFPLFSTVELKLGHSIFQFILRFKIGISECGFCAYFNFFPNSQKENWKLAFVYVALQGLIEKNWASVMLIRLQQDVLGYYTLYRLRTFRRVNSILTCYFVFGYNISYYNTSKLKKELFVFFYNLFLLLLGSQIRGAQTRLSVLASINHCSS